VAGVAGGGASSASFVPTPAAPRGAVAAPVAPPIPVEDIDARMARLEPLSLELYKNNPDRLKERSEDGTNPDDASAHGSSEDPG